MPQFARSVDVLMHMPPHIIKPAPHPVIEHVPALHTAPPVHAWPQVPQLVLLVRRFTHAPLHMISPVGQLVPPSMPNASTAGRPVSCGGPVSRIVCMPVSVPGMPVSTPGMPESIPPVPVSEFVV